ncbi:hypothetical protein PPGU19_091480 (plasmid) [Paraburkholderia sp. PGU19]|nr:hypothetical protein PPGU19_091480 [Paraburkholderia sp. PGU19]
MKPVEYILATITKVDLGAAHGVAAIGEESCRLVAHNAFPREESQHAIDRHLLEFVNVREAMSPAIISQ